MEQGLLGRAIIEVVPGPSHLRVMQWNILADQLAHDFPRVRYEHLTWGFREALIKAEIARGDPDVLVIEELDHYRDSLQPYLQGYASVYHQKPGWHNDGIAVFIRESKVALLCSKVVEFDGQSQFYMLVECELKETGERFVVVGTHLKAKHAFENNRVVEITRLLGDLGLYREWRIVLAGDFNSTPDREVYAKVSTCPLAMRSCYFNTVVPNSEPEFTSFKYRQELYSYTIDYVWVKGWTCKRVMSIPKKEEIGDTGLPGERYPSDHFALVCDLALE